MHVAWTLPLCQINNDGFDSPSGPVDELYVYWLGVTNLLTVRGVGKQWVLQLFFTSFYSVLMSTVLVTRCYPVACLTFLLYPRPFWCQLSRLPCTTKWRSTLGSHYLKTWSLLGIGSTSTSSPVTGSVQHLYVLSSYRSVQHIYVLSCYGVSTAPLRPLQLQGQYSTSSSSPVTGSV